MPRRFGRVSRWRGDGLDAVPLFLFCSGRDGPLEIGEEPTIAGKLDVRVNERIRAPMVRVIAANGDQLGVMAVSEALRLAREMQIDLVEVAPTARPPVCRIMDFGKYKYEQAKREQKAKRKQHVTVLKEVKLRPRVERHDFEFKMRHAREFLGERDKVKITIQFRGRELSHPELGFELMEKVIASLSDVAQVEQRGRLEGRFLTMMLAAKPGVIATPKPGAEGEAVTSPEGDRATGKE